MAKTKRKKVRKKQNRPSRQPADPQRSESSNGDQRDLAFTDRLGGRWDLRLDYAAALRIDRSDFSAITPRKFSVINPDRQFFTDVLSDTRILVAMAWAVVQPQAEAVLQSGPAKDYEAAEAEFLRRLDGGAIRAARDAFWRALSDFFPERKTALSLLMEKHRLGQEIVMEEIQQMGAEIETAIRRTIGQEVADLKQTLQEPLGERPTPSPASSESAAAT